MYWRRFAISAIPIDDHEAFDYWLRQRWIEKDKLLELYHRTGRFPADAGVDKAPDGTTRRGAGHIETEVKAFHWYEFLQIFAPIGLFALVLYTFYGSLPKPFVKSINKSSAKAQIEGTQKKKQVKGPKQSKLLMAPPSKISNNKTLALKKVVPKSAPKKLTGGKTPSKATATQKIPPKAATTQKPLAKTSAIQKAPSKLAIAPKPSTPQKLPPTGTTAQKPIVSKAPTQKVPVPVAKKQQTTAVPKKTESAKLPVKNSVKPLANGAAQAPKKLEAKPKTSPAVKKLPSTQQAPKKLTAKT